MPLSNLYISNSDKRPVTLKLLVSKLWILAAFVIVFLLSLDYFFLQYIIFSSDVTNQGKVKRLIENDNPEEVAIFGSSLARSSFIPDSIGPDCFNYGLGKAIYDVTRVLIEVECDKDKKSPIILEFNPRYFIREPLSTINRATYIPNLDYPIIERFMRESGGYSDGEFKSVFNWHYKVPGLRYYGNYAEYFLGWLKSFRKQNASDRGVILENHVVPESELESFIQRCINMNQERAKLERMRTSPVELYTPIDSMLHRNLNTTMVFGYDNDYVIEFKKRVADNPHRDFILVTVPINPRIKEHLQRFPEFIAFANQLASEYSNVHYLDYSDLPADISNYKDPVHFNEKGARYFMSAFMKDYRQILSQSDN